MAETNAVTSASLAHDIVPLVIRDRLLERGLQTIVLRQFADEIPLPQNNGKTIQATRYERMALPNSPLVEGETPTATPVIASIVQGTVDQWGAVGSITDIANLTIKHPVMDITQDLLGDQRSELVDREIQRVLNGGTNVSFAGTRVSRATLVSGDNLATLDVQKVLATLKMNGARPFAGGKFRGVVDPYQEQDLLNDATFKQASIQQGEVGGGNLVTGMIGTWMGVDWYVSNTIPAIGRTTAVTPVSLATLTGTGGSFTGFTAGSTVRVKFTTIDTRTGAETFISPETAVTNAGAFLVSFPALPVGTYNLYVSVEGGAAGTATFQGRVTVPSGTIGAKIAAGVGTTTSLATGEFIAVNTGAVAPPDASATGVNVHVAYIFGKGAFGLVNLAGLSTYMTPATATDSDPLVQRRKVGWKQIYKAMILNPNFYRRIETTSAFN